MIIDHNRSLPKSGSPHLSTPNKSPSPLPHKPTPQQTAKSQQVHTHQSDESTTDTIKTETTSSDPLLAMVHQSINTSADDASDISNVLSLKRSHQIQVCQCYLFQHANHTNQQLVDRGANGGLAGSDMNVIHKTQRKINIQGICPVQTLEGITPDISFMLHFSFNEPVYYRIDSSEPDLNFPSSSIKMWC